MLIDNVEIIAKAGNGGNGKVSFIRNGQTSKGGPDGGNGGNGGNIYFKGSSNINDLHDFRFKKEVLGEVGVSGGKNNLYGKNAEHKIVLLPIGTVVTNLETNETFEILNENEILIVRGGKGGLGNNEFKSATNRAPKYAESGEKGEEKKLKLELKLIADIGLIGLPNAGKSTLLSLLTNANPKIANYPFTTLEPNIGVFHDLNSKTNEKITFADIPGLIEGASEGKGLGIKFLKHIEKTKIFLHCIDSSSERIKNDYEIIRKELGNYNKELLLKKEIILFTKTDLIDDKTLNKNIKLFKDIKVLTISINKPETIEILKKYLLTNL